MNQILVTGDEYTSKPIKGHREPREKKVLGINGIVIFYAISTIILGICMISGSVYAKGKINQAVTANAKPTVQINRNDDNNTVEINVTHIRGIKTITYRWNEEEEIMLNGNNQKSVEKVLELPGGTNTLTVTVTEENGQTVKYDKTFIAGNIPEIQLEPVSNGIKIISTSEKGIDYITYSWDNGEKQKIAVGQKDYEGIINIPQGKHTLKLEVVDSNGNKATKEQVVVGDTEPTLTIQHDPVNQKMIIDAEDDEGLTTMEITLNGEKKQTINISDKTYHKELDMVDGENKLKVTVYNVNGIQKTLRVFAVK